uniref:Uncharacterized protein n=1 Tax=Cannabis sativa TaxID=3483 RepID=A0A803QUG8_CANSA
MSQCSKSLQYTFSIVIVLQVLYILCKFEVCCYFRKENLIDSLLVVNFDYHYLLSPFNHSLVLAIV